MFILRVRKSLTLRSSGADERVVGGEDVFEFGELGEREGKLLGAGLYVGDAAHHRQLVQTYFTEYALKVDTRPVEEVGDDGELDQPQIDGVALCLVSGKQLAERVTLGGYHLLALVKETRAMRSAVLRALGLMTAQPRVRSAYCRRRRSIFWSIRCIGVMG